MKVTNNGVSAVKLYKDNKPSATNGNNRTGVSRYDTLEISKEGQELAKYAQIANNIKDVRINKVDEIKNKIQSGKYKVSSEEIANEILQTIKGEKI